MDGFLPEDQLDAARTQGRKRICRCIGEVLGNYILDYRAGFKYNGFMKTITQSRLEDPSMTFGWVKYEHEITPIWMGKDDRWVPAEIHEGLYIGTDGKERFDSGTVYGLDSAACFKVFGECYPFGTVSGAGVSYYLKNGALMRVRKDAQA